MQQYTSIVSSMAQQSVAAPFGPVPFQNFSVSQQPGPSGGVRSPGDGVRSPVDPERGPDLEMSVIGGQSQMPNVRGKSLYLVHYTYFCQRFPKLACAPVRLCTLATDTSVYIVMWSWKLGKTRKY